MRTKNNKITVIESVKPWERGTAGNNDFICEKIFLLLKKIETIFEKINFSNFFLNLDFHEKNFYFLNEKISHKIFIIMKVVKTYKKFFRNLFLKFLNMKKMALSLTENVLQIKNFFEDLLILNMNSIEIKRTVVSKNFNSEFSEKIFKFRNYINYKYKISQIFKNTLSVKFNRFCSKKTIFNNRKSSFYFLNEKFNSKKLFFLFLKSKNEIFERFIEIKNYLVNFLINKNSIKLNKKKKSCLKNYKNIQSYDLLVLIRFLSKKIKKLLGDMKKQKKKILTSRHKKNSVVTSFCLLKWINIFFSGFSLYITNTIFLIEKDFFSRITSLFKNLCYRVLIVKKIFISGETDNKIILNERNNEIKKEFFFLWKNFNEQKLKYSFSKKKIMICKNNTSIQKKNKIFSIIKSLLIKNKSLKKLLFIKITTENKYHQKLEEIRGMESDLNLMLDSKFH